MDELSATELSWSLQGDQDPQYVVAGHSHVVSLLSCLLEGVAVGVPAAVAYSASLGDVPSDPSYWDFFVDSARDRVAVVVWNGNQHQASFLVAPDPELRVYHPAVPAELYEDGRPGTWIPRSLFREYWDWTYADLSQLLENLSQRSLGVVVIGTPPPKTEAMIREVLHVEPAFVEHANRLGLKPNELRLTAAHTRLAMWNVIQDDMREITESAGGFFLPVPTRLRDALGFLLPEYSSPDATHANSYYGAEMWEEVTSIDIGGFSHGE